MSAQQEAEHPHAESAHTLALAYQSTRTVVKKCLLFKPLRLWQHSVGALHSLLLMMERLSQFPA